MRFSTLIPLLLAAGVAQAQKGKTGQNNNNNANAAQAAQAAKASQAAAAQNQNNNNGGNNNNNNNNGNANSLALNAANVQNGSASTGLDASAEAGQAASDTSNNNFINFCQGKTLTNGLQVKGGSCNGIPMGDIPANTKMISAIMVNPQNGQTIQANKAINFQVQISNLQAGSFTNPDDTYYAAPQALNSQGQVIGHTHISVQDMGGNANPTTPLDATKFAFFKGINDAGNGNGLLTANLSAGLPAGVYRVCSMTSASNHQPVLMPVAQRGPQDDCNKFTVSANGQANGNANANANNGNANANANNGNANANAQAAKGGQKGGKGRLRFAARDFIA